MRGSRRHESHLRSARKVRRPVASVLIVALLLPYPGNLAVAAEAPSANPSFVDQLEMNAPFSVLYEESAHCSRVAFFSQPRKLEADYSAWFAQCAQAKEEAACSAVLDALTAPSKSAISTLESTPLRAAFGELARSENTSLRAATLKLSTAMGLASFDSLPKAKGSPCAAPISPSKAVPRTVYVPKERMFLAQAPSAAHLVQGPDVGPYKAELSAAEKDLARHRALFLAKHSTPEIVGGFYAYGEWQKAGGRSKAHEFFAARDTHRKSMFPDKSLTSEHAGSIERVRKNAQIIVAGVNGRITFGPGANNPWMNAADVTAGAALETAAKGAPVYQLSKIGFTEIRRNQAQDILGSVSNAKLGEFADSFSAYRSNPELIQPMMEEAMRSPLFATMTNETFSPGGKPILYWTKAEMKAADPNYDAPIKQQETEKQVKQLQKDMNQLVDNTNQARKQADGILKDGGDPKQVIKNARAKLDEIEKKLGLTSEPEELTREQKQAIVDTYQPYIDALDMAMQLVGNNKPAAAAIAVTKAAAEVALLSAVASGAALTFGIAAIVYALGRALYAIFGSSGPSIEETILEEIRALRKEVRDLDVRMTRKLDDIEYDLGTLRDHIDDEFDRIEKRLRGDFADVNARLRSTERTAQVGIDRVAQLKQDTQDIALAAVREKEVEALDFLRQALTDLSKTNLSAAQLEKIEREVFPQWLYRKSMNYLQRSATTFSRSSIRAGADLPQAYNGPRDRSGKIEEFQRFLAEQLPHLKLSQNIRLMEKTLAVHGINITPEKPSYLVADAANSYEEGAISLNDWTRNARAFASIAGQDHPLYRDYYCAYDPNLAILRNLIDEGAGQLQALRNIAPRTANGSPSMHQLIRLFAHYEEQIDRLVYEIKISGDPAEIQKKIALIRAFKNYDESVPASVEALKKLTTAEAGLKLLKVRDQAVRPCSDYQPKDSQGHALAVPPLPINTLVNARGYLEQMPPLLVAASQYLEGKMEICYDAIDQKDGTIDYRAHVKDGSHSIKAYSIGKVGARLNFFFTPSRSVPHLFSRLIIKEPEAIEWRFTDIDPIFEESAKRHLVNIMPASDVSGAKNRAVWDETVRLNSTHEGDGAFVGMAITGGVPLNDNIEQRAPERFARSWVTMSLEDQIIRGKADQVFPVKDRDASLKSLAQMTGELLESELWEFLDEKVRKEVEAQTGPLGESLRNIESARILLESTLWLAFGDTMASDTQLQSLVGALPGKYAFIRSVMENPGAIADQETRRFVQKKMHEPLVSLLQHLSDSRKSSGLRTSHLAMEGALDQLKELYLQKERDPKCSPNENSRPTFLRAEIGTRKRATSENAQDIQIRRLQQGYANSWVELSAQDLALMNDVLAQWGEKTKREKEGVALDISELNAATELLADVLREGHVSKRPLSPKTQKAYEAFAHGDLVRQLHLLTAGGKTALDLPGKEAAGILRDFQKSGHPLSVDTLDVMVTAKQEELAYQSGQEKQPLAATYKVLNYVAPGQTAAEQLKSATAKLEEVRLAIHRDSAVTKAAKDVGDAKLVSERVSAKHDQVVPLLAEAQGHAANPRYAGAINARAGIKNIGPQVAQLKGMKDSAAALHAESAKLLETLVTDKTLDKAAVDALYGKIKEKLVALDKLQPVAVQLADYYINGSINDVRAAVHAVNTAPPERSGGRFDR